MELYTVCEHQEFMTTLDAILKYVEYLTKELAKASVSRIVIERRLKHPCDYSPLARVSLSLR